MNVAGVSRREACLLQGIIVDECRFCNERPSFIVKAELDCVRADVSKQTSILSGEVRESIDVRGGPKIDINIMG